MKFPRQWVAVLVFVCTLAIASNSVIVSAQCNGRVRKDWDTLSSSEKATYRGAIAAAMDSGAYIKFVEIHTEMMSEMEAHRQCMFVYWHRLLLIVFENMLRGQGSQYACVTIPYWDWISAHARFTNNQCSSMADCSPILTELGGVPSGSQQGQLTINGIQTQGYCVSADPTSRFCQSTSARTSNQCVHCVPRGPWGSTTFPGSASLASVRSQLFSARNIAEMSTAIENGAHDAIHANLAGAMETFASNSDPIFYSHHAMVDLLHVTFHHCRVGDAMLTLQQKAQNSIGWTSCERRGGGVFNPLDTVLMRTGENGVNPTYVSQDAIIGQYFQGVPNQYAALMDVRDLATRTN
uniref:Tyrosinase copper-binding domain-containing protein n=1 Tax=Globisporangium ultimum (strain ATCC 200006 / CBS 805.95 / DAOM BR144) TaxID=431595 RepID=K3X1J2_GLOUD